MTDRDKRAEIEERLAEILDGDAPQELYDAIAESDEYRDLRYVAERAIGVARDCAADYVPSADLEARIMAALEKHLGASTTAGEGAESTEGGQPAEPSKRPSVRSRSSADQCHNRRPGSPGRCPRRPA